MNQIFSGEAFRAGKATALIEGASREIRTQQIANDPAMAALAENLLMTCVVIYIDDIVIFSKSPEEHVAHVQKVLNRLRAYELLLKSEKCAFAQKEVEYLGHRVTPEGITVCQDKIEAVREWPRPKTVGDIRQFLGLSGFYRRFINGYSQIAAPMTDLTHLGKYDATGTLHDFPAAANDAFEKLKKALCSAPVLALPEPQKGGFHIMCDASIYGLGATLFQAGGGMENYILARSFLAYSRHKSGKTTHLNESAFMSLSSEH